MHDKGSDGGSDSSRSVRALKAGNGWKTPGSNGGGGGGGDGWNNTGGNGNDQWNNAAW